MEQKGPTGPGLVQVFYGTGKGKTTAALGTALRACGGGFKVHLVQFMKNGTNESREFDKPGEIVALENFPNFSYKRFGAGKWIIGKPEKEHIDKAAEALAYIKECFKGDYDIIIADEILYAVQLGLLTEEDVIKLIECKPENKELILTGGHVPFPRVFEKAHLVSEIKKIKHPYDSNILARKGLEY